MTLAPSETWNVRGVDGPQYKVAAHCANPGCTHFTDHAHHIWRRSQLGGDYRWVVVEGKLLANLTGLCAGCHGDVTGEIGGHRAAIRYDLENDVFNWCRVVTLINGKHEFHEVGPLDPQPPDPDSLAERASGKDHDPVTCPFCGQTRRRPSGVRDGSAGGRRRKSWPVSVPADEQEQGADTLDALVDDLAPLLGLTAGPSARYYVLVPALFYAQQNRRNFVETIAGVGA
jgi:hypothetical protein